MFLWLGTPDEHGQGIHQRERHDEPKHGADGVIKFVVLVGCLLAVKHCKSGDNCNCMVVHAGTLPPSLWRYCPQLASSANCHAASCNLPMGRGRSRWSTTGRRRRRRHCPGCRAAAARGPCPGTPPASGRRRRRRSAEVQDEVLKKHMAPPGHGPHNHPGN